MTLFEEFKNRNVFLRSLVIDQEKDGEEDVGVVEFRKVIARIETSGKSRQMRDLTYPRPESADRPLAYISGMDHLRVCPWHSGLSPPGTPRKRSRDDFHIVYSNMQRREREERSKETSPKSGTKYDGNSVAEDVLEIETATQPSADSSVTKSAMEREQQAIENEIKFIIDQTVEKFHTKLELIEKEFIESANKVRDLYQQSLTKSISKLDVPEVPKAPTE